MLAAICAGESIGRSAARNEGSPTLVVPPPIRVIGRWPVFCSQRSIMTLTRLPTWSERAVAS